jgi:hypothetical protein
VPKPTRNARSYRGLNPCQWPLRLKVIWPSAPLRLREARPFRRQRSGFLLQRTTAVLTEIVVFGIDSASATERRRLTEAKMPGDPKECRQHALNCAQLAKGASTAEQRDHFAKLARTWIKLAEELEQTEAFLAAIEDEEPTKKAG